MGLKNWILFMLHVVLAVSASGHALLYKREPRAALGWIAVCIIFPLGGPFLYFLFGINRIRTRAKKLEKQSPFRIDVGYERSEDEDMAIVSRLPVSPEFMNISRVSDAVTGRPLVDRNRIRILQNGEQAYPAMIETIRRAEKRLYLSTYIFETNDTGLNFINALADAHTRGVDVRIIIDGIGEIYSIPRAGTLLKRRGVRIARFIPPRLVPPSLNINLRNHRKILVADGRVGFIGGMNIGDRHLAERIENPSRVIDTHFQLEGPVVNQIEAVFLEDWGFCTGERGVPSALNGFQTGGAICRTIVDGPNEDMDKLALILVGAVSLAKVRVLIMTPYFLPSRDLIAALQAAALRGAAVTILLPSRSNLPFVNWASMNMLWELLQRGVRIFYQPPPFVHTKYFIIDDYYAQIGSANIDPRSLRLNFELTVEVYDKPFVDELSTHVERSLKRSKEIFLEDVDNRPLPVRVRDATAWLFSPYL